MSNIRENKKIKKQANKIAMLYVVCYSGVEIVCFLFVFIYRRRRASRSDSRRTRTSSTRLENKQRKFRKQKQLFQIELTLDPLRYE